ncbi:MAG: hypothetical protein RL701_7553 [Pseudomonadota bacterium]
MHRDAWFEAANRSTQVVLRFVYLQALMSTQGRWSHSQTEGRYDESVTSQLRVRTLAPCNLPGNLVATTSEFPAL